MTDSIEPQKGAPVDGKRSILAISSLYPRPARPLFGIFNRQALVELSALARIALLSPVSWIDRMRDRRGRRAGAGPGDTAVREHGGGAAPVPYYATSFSIPVIGRGFNGYFQYRAMRETAARLHAAMKFECLLCYWAYPDGYAAHLLSRALGIPYVVVALGSDLNVMGRAGQTRTRIGTTLAGAARVVCVSDALRSRAIELGTPRDRCRVVPNGIDPELFAPRPRAESRSRLGIAGDERLLLYIGNMHPIKGVDVLLDALALIEHDRPGAILIGGGPSLQTFRRQAAGRGLGARITFTGPIPHEDTALFLNAADLLVLPSRFEGCPNVVLEALACGTPVIASSVGGIPELITRPEQGILVPPEAPAALARAIEEGFGRAWRREEIARTSTRTWKDVARETLAIIEEFLDSERA